MASETDRVIAVRDGLMQGARLTKIGIPGPVSVSEYVRRAREANWEYLRRRRAELEASDEQRACRRDSRGAGSGAE